MHADVLIGRLGAVLGGTVSSGGRRSENFEVMITCSDSRFDEPRATRHETRPGDTSI